MDHLFRPWRYAYVTSERPETGCILCDLAASDPADDASTFILHRARSHYLVLNIYPYNTGHLMIVPFLHVARLADLPSEAIQEMLVLAARAEVVLGEVYRPDGINLGMNLGRSAGAGIADHVHLHLVPRWAADTNFVTVTGEARILPEDLHETWRKLYDRF
jgi:ATP adenylyltransferase